MKANYHTHTQRCRHAGGSEEDYVRAALDAGLSILGFSDHAPFPDHDYGYRMPYDELGPYFSAVERLAKAHDSDIIIRKGLEIEYAPRYMPYYEQLFDHWKVDYLLLGEHFYADSSGEIRFISQAQDTEANVCYACAIAEALKTGLFSMVAHPDLFAMNFFAWDKNCDAACDIILDAAAQSGAVLEYNANGYRRGIHDYPDEGRYMYPHKKFWEEAARAGLPVIIGADCHDPAQVWDECMPRAREDLANLGITALERLENL